MNKKEKIEHEVMIKSVKSSFLFGIVISLLLIILCSIVSYTIGHNNGIKYGKAYRYATAQNEFKVLNNTPTCPIFEKCVQINCSEETVQESYDKMIQYCEAEE